MTIVALLFAACTVEPSAERAGPRDAVSEAAVREPPPHEALDDGPREPEEPTVPIEPRGVDAPPAIEPRDTPEVRASEGALDDEVAEALDDDFEYDHIYHHAGPRFRFRERAGEPPGDLALERTDTWEIARAPGHRRLWMRRNDEGHRWLALSLSGAPPGTQLFTFTDDEHGRWMRQLVAVAYPRAWIVDAAYDDGAEVHIRPIELRMAGPRGTRPRDALAASVELRRMKACTRAGRPCMVFGAPEHVASAVDPLYPLHGLSVRVLSLPAAPEHGPIEPVAREPRLGIRRMPGISEGSRPVAIVFHHPRGDRTSFVMPLFHEPRSAYGIQEVGEHVLVWASYPGWFSGFALHDAVTGERVGAPVVVAVSRYYGDSDAHPLPHPRALPVIAPGGPLVAVFDRGSPVPLYDLGGRYLRDVEVAWEDVPPSGESTSVPPFVELGDDGLLH